MRPTWLLLERALFCIFQQLFKRPREDFSLRFISIDSHAIEEYNNAVCAEATTTYERPKSTPSLSSSPTISLDPAFVQTVPRLKYKHPFNFQRISKSHSQDAAQIVCSTVSTHSRRRTCSLPSPTHVCLRHPLSPPHRRSYSISRC